MSAGEFCENSQVATLQKFADKQGAIALYPWEKETNIVIYQSEDGLVRMEARAAVALKIL